MPVSFTTKTLKFSAVLLYLFPIIVFAGPTAQSDQDYRQYHMEINEAEKFVSTENFEEAFHLYEQVFNTYDFVFLRDYKIAAQISFYIDNREKTFEYITKGISAGWELKELKKHNYLDPLRDDPGWEVIEDAYPDLRRTYESGIDEGVREQVHQMFKRDQWKALGAMLRIGAKAKERFYLNKFAPHSEIQMARLIEILERQGYPGEKLIGNDFWMSTIISHHNSISQEYVEMDTLYSYIEPVLIQAIENGQMSP